MSSLLEKFEKSAEVRLLGRDPKDDLGPYRAFVKVESHRLKLLHRAGGSGVDVSRARAQFVDVLIRHLWLAAKERLSPQARKEFPPLALVALGGYGRGELSPLSDLDLMFLHHGQVVVADKPLPSLATVMEGIVTPLWDLGFKPHPNVRTISDCVEAANSRTDPKSMESKTALIEARFVTGDEKLFDKLQKAVLSRCVEGHEDEYIAQRMKDQGERRERFGNSATMQEPNIKNGCGGLRDFQSLQWMTHFKYRTRSLKDLEARGFMTEAERKQLEKAYDLLLRTRMELHYQIPPNSKQGDVLLKALQPAVALELGYTDRSQSRRIEKFMRDLYFNMRNVFLITRTLEERLALLPKAQRLPDFRKYFPAPFRKPAPQVVDGFRFGDGQIHAAAPRVFREQPRRLMRVFLHAQQRGLRLHPDLAQAVRQNLDLADRAFLQDEHVRETFLEILSQRGNVAGVLRTMHETGLLGRYLPEFGKLTCLVQHEFYHQYAADEHTLMCLTQLDRVWEAQAQPYAHYAEVFQSVERPFILHLALLLHDAGKALRTGNHSDVGGQLALRVARRLALDGATTHSLRLLIEQHLSMTQISQRRDLEDSSVIRNFAAQIQSAENLRMLMLHTFADSMATSDKLWNGFKDSLLWTLYHKSLQVLLGGTDFIRAEERQREILAEEVRGLLPKTVESDEVEAHFGALPARYFQIHQAREIAGDMALTHRFLHKQVDDADDALEPVLSWHNERDRGHTRAKICTWDRAGLFATINGSFAAAGINILSAQIFSRMDGIALDTFCVTDAHTGEPVAREARDRFEDLLARSLSDEPVDLQALIARQKAGKTPYLALPGERIPTRVYFDNESSEHQTVIDIETEDRLGLLYRIAQELTEVGLDISLAKISTEKGAAIDSFYVSERGGLKVLSPERQRYIAGRLLAALNQPG